MPYTITLRRSVTASLRLMLPEPLLGSYAQMLHHSGDLHDVFFLRWSPEELREVDLLSEVIHAGNQRLVMSDTTSLFKVSINILELAAALFALIKWGPSSGFRHLLRHPTTPPLCLG
jgi:hypothetical protein